MNTDAEVEELEDDQPYPVQNDGNRFRDFIVTQHFNVAN